MPYQNSWYVIDHSTKLGHPAIFVLHPQKVICITINKKPGYKIILANGQIFYVDQDSRFFDIEEAKRILKLLANKINLYANSALIEILDAEKENLIIDPSI